MISDHFLRLEQLFLKAPIQQNIIGQTISIAEGTALIKYHVNNAFFHGGNAQHGAIYFKLLDDASYFAAASLVSDRFLLTASFEIKLFKPVTEGMLTATGSCKMAGDRIIYAEANLMNEHQELVATGAGRFQRGKQLWASLPGYSG
ncbi:MAG TPA: PaaI family thioesterase [Chitinophagales bacterium]|nr:PaaI family thioesterase [Chitinophagales bacterium]HNA56996.1 PaaI family thioesterase [Chitinophagales bacterium]HNI54882.1 PaaI family thioesterase [Chitinophagales bacterium]HNJ88889.1 PaaI family thioesterase [Chitinophagales bacterium]HNK97972.1 PaaI family thioesterase [Chitinophagales bacterium]